MKNKMFLLTKNSEIADTLKMYGFPYLGFNNETYQFLNNGSKFAGIKDQLDMEKIIETDTALM